MFNNFMSSDDNFKTMIGIKGVEKYNKYANAIKGVASYAPYVGAAIGVAEFFIGLSKKNNAGVQTETPPATFYSSFKLKGEILLRNDVASKVFYNPGHPVTNSVEAFKPFYDNPLGIFHILKAPLVESYDLVRSTTKDLPTHHESLPVKDGNDNVVNISNNTNWVWQWNLKEDIKYVVNPASDLEVESIDAAFVLEYDKNTPLYVTSTNTYSPITPFPFNKNYAKDVSLEDRINDIKEHGMELEYLTKDYPTGDNSYIRFRTEYAPLQCLKNVNFVTVGCNNGNMKVYIKMLVRLKVKNSNNFVTQIVMYDISKSFLLENVVQSTESGEIKLTIKPTTFEPEYVVGGGSSVVAYHAKYWNVSKAELITPKSNFNFNPKTINFTTGMGNSNAKEVINIKANQHIGDNITLTALEEINIEAGVTFGNNVLLRAGNATNVAQGVQITPNTKLEIIKDPQLFKINCTNPDIAALHATNTEIAAICSSTAYQSRAESVEVPNPKPVKPIIEKLNFNIYPNPNNGNFNVSIEEANEAWELTLSDITGKQILTQTIAKGQVLANVNTVNLMSGIYLVTVKANGKERTEKLIIQSNN